MEHTMMTEFMPHGHCYLWKPEILWLHVISDAVIMLSYFAIPIFLTMIIIKSRGKIPFNWLFLLFALFILACGTTHFLEIINVWHSKYMLAGIVKAVTAIVSLATAIALIKLIPTVVKLLKNDSVDHL